LLLGLQGQWFWGKYIYQRDEEKNRAE